MIKIYVVSIGGRYPVLAQVLTDRGLSGAGETAVAYGTGGRAAAAMIKGLAEGFLARQGPFADRGSLGVAVYELLGGRCLDAARVCANG